MIMRDRHAFREIAKGNVLTRGNRYVQQFRF